MAEHPRGTPYNSRLAVTVDWVVNRHSVEYTPAGFKCEKVPAETQTPAEKEPGNEVPSPRRQPLARRGGITVPATLLRSRSADREGISRKSGVYSLESGEGVAQSNFARRKITLRYAALPISDTKYQMCF